MLAPSLTANLLIAVAVSSELKLAELYKSFAFADVLQGRSHATVHFPHRRHHQQNQVQRAPSQNFRRVASVAPGVDAPQVNGDHLRHLLFSCSANLQSDLSCAVFAQCPMLHNFQHGVACSVAQFWL